MEIVLIVLGALLSIIGLIGCIVPALPGTPLNFLALLLLNWARDPNPFRLNFLIIMGIIAVGVTLIDNFIPAWGAKRYGAARISVWLALAGTMIGIFFFAPFGIIIGAFVGALLGELLSGKKSGDALRAGWGVFVGVFLGILFKVIASGFMTFHFIKGLL